MPYKDKEIEKMYFSISEVAKQFNVAASLIRFWETEFEILKPKKTTKGNRLYSKKDIENAEIITRLKKIRSFLESMYNEL